MRLPVYGRALGGALAIAVVLVVALIGAPSLSVRAASPTIGTSSGQVVRGTTISTEVRSLPSAPARPMTRPPLPSPRATRPDVAVSPGVVAPAVATMPTPSQSFAGLSFNGLCGSVQCGGGWPPDPNGDVSPSHYVEVVNTAMGVYDKSGNQLAAVTFDSLWSTANSGTPCDNNNQGDPTAVYDPTTGLWTIADFAFALSGQTALAPFYECIALVPDSGLVPVGPGWKLFAVETDLPVPGTNGAAFPDYPKMAAWPDGLYMTANMFNAAGTTFLEARLWAFDIADAYPSGQLKLVMTDTNTAAYSLLASNDRSSTPPSGSPNYVVGEDLTSFNFDVFTYRVDYTTPSNSTLVGPVKVSQQSFTQPQTTNGNTDIVPQPTTTIKLDSLGDRLMVESQYLNLGGVESLWVAHTVRLGSNQPTAIQWAQLDVTGGTIATTPVQQQIWSNGADGLYRWVPSVAVDRLGDLAVGYSVSNATTEFPSIRYAGRLSSDPPNDLAQGETSLIEGSGSQTSINGLVLNRWGDYTLMTLDPTDQCTFWYVDEYYATTGNDWQTRVGTFTYPACANSPLPTPTQTSTVTSTQTSTPTATLTIVASGSPGATGSPAPVSSGTPVGTPGIEGTPVSEFRSYVPVVLDSGSP